MFAKPLLNRGVLLPQLGHPLIGSLVKLATGVTYLWRGVLVKRRFAVVAQGGTARSARWGGDRGIARVGWVLFGWVCHRSRWCGAGDPSRSSRSAVRCG